MNIVHTSVVPCMFVLPAPCELESIQRNDGLEICCALCNLSSYPPLSLPPTTALPPSLASEGTTTGMSGLQYQQPGDDLANATQLVPVDHGVDASTMDSSGMDASLDASVDMSVDTTCSGLVASSTVTGMSQTPVSDDTGQELLHLFISFSVHAYSGTRW